MNQFLEIKTDRLILGVISYQDIPKIVEYASNEKVAKTTFNIPHPYTEEDAVFWIESAHSGFKNENQYTFGIRLKTSTDLIGGIGLILNKDHNRASLGYWVAEPFWNKGIATEAVEAVLKFGFEKLNLNKIYATHLRENQASGKVMIKNRMIKEGELKEHSKKGDLYRSLFLYRLTKSEFENM